VEFKCVEAEAKEKSPPTRSRGFYPTIVGVGGEGPVVLVEAEE
jgi:hypothetical protein